MSRAVLLALVLLAAPRVLADDPTPFWLPADTTDAPTKKAPAPKPSKKKAPAPAPTAAKKKPAPPPLPKTRERPAPSPAPGALEEATRGILQTAPAAAPVVRKPTAPELPTRRPVELESAPVIEHARLVEPVVQPLPPVAEDPPVARERRPFSAFALGGTWGKSTSDAQGRSWQLATGLALGFSPRPWLDVEFLAARAGETTGNPFAHASATHTLFAARLDGVFDRGWWAAYAGAGGGAALSQSHYTLQDVGQPASGLDASALKLVALAGAGLRLRPWRGLQVRAEVCSLLRDQRLDVISLFGVGWAF